MLKLIITLIKTNKLNNLGIQTTAFHQFKPNVRNAINLDYFRKSVQANRFQKEGVGLRK